MINRFLWPTLAILIFGMACGEEENQKKKPTSVATTETSDEDDQKLPPMEDPVTSAGIKQVDCALFPPDAIVPLSQVRRHTSLVAIPLGAIVEWKNDLEDTHTVTSENYIDGNGDEKFDLGVLEPGHSTCAQFMTVGDFDYFCQLHSEQMHDDRIQVTPPP